MHQSVLRHAKQNILFRLLPLLFAAIMLLSGAPAMVRFFSQQLQELTAVAPEDLPVDEHTLKITLDGSFATSMDLPYGGKKIISADGLKGKATYQWQIKHPEKENVWVNIYDATSKELPVTAALVKSVLNEQGNAYLRCRAYTDTYAYLTPAITVKLADLGSGDPLLGATGGFGSLSSGGQTPLGSGAAPIADDSNEFVTITIEYLRYDFLRDNMGQLVKDDKGKLVYDEPTVAFMSYVATLEPNSYLPETVVPNPTLVGYDRYLVTDGGDVLSSSVTIPEGIVTQDITYTVKYVPADVKYTVRYYFQNIYDDLYVEDHSVLDDKGVAAGIPDLKGPTGSEPDPDYTEREFPGFTSLYYEPDAIAADGSTAFEVYYERDYYLMEFDCAGGYGTDTLYVRYGTYISVPTPVRTGYQFMGWNKGEIIITPGNKTQINFPAVANPNSFVGATLPLTMPHENTAYQAVWAIVETTYTIVYWKADLQKDGQPTTYSYWGQATAEAMSNSVLTPSEIGDLAENRATAAKIYPGVTSFYQEDKASTVINEVPFFTYDKEATRTKNLNTKDPIDPENPEEKTVTVEGDGSTIINVYYSRNTYTIRFYYARVTGSRYYVATNTNAGTVTGATWSRMQSKPTVTGYTEYSEVIDGSTYYYFTLTAEYQAKIEDQWPVANALPTVNYQSSWSGLEDILLSGSHYDCGSWAAEKGTPYYTHNSSNAKIIGPYPYMEADLIKSNPTEISKGHYLAQSMVGWWGNSALWGLELDILDFAKINTHTYHMYFETVDAGVYEPVHSVTFLAAHNGSTPIKPFDYPGYHYVNKHGEDLSNTNTAENNPNCPNPAGSKCTYCNVLYYDRNDYTISFYNYNSMSVAPPSVSITYGAQVNSKLTELPTLENGGLQEPSGIEKGAYQFMGWYISPVFDESTKVTIENLGATTMPAENVTLYAKWEPVTHEVVFYTLYTDIAADNPTFYGPVSVTHGKILETAYDLIPEREGYQFVGWFYMDEDNKKRFAPDSMEISRDLVLFAEWQSGIATTYKVTYALEEQVSLTAPFTLPADMVFQMSEKIGDASAILKIGETEYKSGDVIPKGTVLPVGTTFPIGTQISNPTAGYSTAGKTKTFTAKGVTELYPVFQNNIFPSLSSHSILMDEDETQNEFEFTYVHDEGVWYQIRYVNYVTREDIIEPSETMYTEEAIKTIKFKPIPGYVPQSYYVRKAFVSDGDNVKADPVLEENIIVFYYIKDDEHGMYSFEYYLENEDSDDSSNVDNYHQYESIVGSADLLVDGQPNTITAPIREYNGYTHVPALNTVITFNADGSENATTVGGAPEGVVSQNGLTIKVYYKRVEYAYIIEYREYGADENAAPLWTITNVDSTAKFDTVITHTAEESKVLNVAGQNYTYLYYDPDAAEGEDTRTKSVKIRVFNGDDPATPEVETNPNKLVFYYTLKKVQINYYAVCTAPGAIDFGRVSLNGEQAATSAGLAGANAMPGDGYVFAGWYTAATCRDTEKVPASWRYTPGTLGAPDVQNNEGTKLKPGAWDNNVESLSYYALFAPISTSMTIENQLADGSGTQNFVFHVQGQGKLSYVDITFVITGTGEVTLDNLPIGDYTVTCTTWSWESAPDEASREITVAVGGENTVSFTNTYADSNWLDGEAAPTVVTDAD